MKERVSKFTYPTLQHSLDNAAQNEPLFHASVMSNRTENQNRICTIEKSAKALPYGYAFLKIHKNIPTHIASYVLLHCTVSSFYVDLELFENYQTIKNLFVRKKYKGN